MPTPLPTPLAAALGVVPTVFLGVRRLPGKAFSLPVHAITTTLNTLDALRREYDQLAERGEQFALRLRGGAVELVEDVSDRADDVEERVTDLVGRAASVSAPSVSVPSVPVPSVSVPSVSAAYDKVEDALEDASRTIGRRAGATLRAVADTADEASDRAANLAGDLAGDLQNDLGSGRGGGLARDLATDLATDLARSGQPAGLAEGGEAAGPVPVAEQPKGAPTPRATGPDTSRVDTAASADVVATVEQAVSGATREAVPAHDELPLPDYDHMTLGSLRGRLRSLSVEQLAQLRAYEKGHADRLPVVTMLDNRIAKLATDAAAVPSGPVSLEPAPEQRITASAGAGISPATTNAPTINPPSQGVPTNPAQPR